MIFALIKFAPTNEVAHVEGKSNSWAAFLGLIKVISRPRVWLAGMAAMCIYWALC